MGMGDLMEAERQLGIDPPKRDKVVAEIIDNYTQTWNGGYARGLDVSAERLAKLEKLIEAADYLQHCRRREIQATAFGYSTSAKRSVERASDTYDYLRGQVKL
jgi:hypothetical protein